jgi:hypothetical protein
MTGTLWIGLLILLGSLLVEIYAPERLKEGFASFATTKAVAVSDSNSILAKPFPRRGDVTFNKEAENYIQDRRYFSGYADVQRIGVANDFCRMLMPKGGDKTDMFFACALAGTGKLSTTTFATAKVKDGFRISRDDYMRDVNKEGRYSYCRILREKGDDTFQPMCLAASDFKFETIGSVDPSPPNEIVELLDFYSGCVMWLRFYDDMLDYIDNVYLQKTNGLHIEEYPPRPAITRGLHFNGLDQYIRLGDANDLTLGAKVNLRLVRTISVWVYFDEFTNNAHIFDFGNGPGQDNVFLGIIRKGDDDSSNGALLRSTAECGADNVLPDGISGAQPVEEMSPQRLMLSTQGFQDCPMFEVTPRKLQPSKPLEPTTSGPKTTATLLYEVWDKRLRKMQIKVSKAIPLKKWTHICITALTNDAMRPDIGVFVNAEQLFVQPAGFLPQPTISTNNYIGKSNWYSDSSQYELRDELFSGSLFDFRLCESAFSPEKVRRVMRWGSKKLGIVS